MPHATELEDSSLKGFLAENKVALVDFYADWCGSCQTLMPLINEIAAELKGKVAFAKMNIEHNGETAGKYGIMSLPTLLIFNDGKMVDVSWGRCRRT